MDIKTLKNFVTVAECGSILKAAAELHISQPPLSKQMQALEKELNVTLFVRTPRGIRLTDKGELLYKKALSLISYSESILTELHEPSADTINIGIVTSSTDYALDIISSYCAEKNVIFSIHEKESFEHIKMLEKGLLDMALVRSPFEISDDVVSLKITDDSLTFVGKKEFLESRMSDASLEDMVHIPLIITRRWYNHIKKYWPDGIQNLNFRYICQDNHTALSMARRNMGVAIVPGTASASMADNEDYLVRHFTDERLQTGLFLLYNKKIPASSSVRDFIEYIISQKL